MIYCHLQCAVLCVHVLICSLTEKIFLYVSFFFFVQVLTQIFQFLKVLTRWTLQYPQRAHFMITHITLNTKGAGGIGQMY